MKPLSVKIVKGFTKTQCVLFNLLSCADVDLNSAEAMEILKDSQTVLPRVRQGMAGPSPRFLDASLSTFAGSIAKLFSFLIVSMLLIDFCIVRSDSMLTLSSKAFSI